MHKTVHVQQSMQRANPFSRYCIDIVYTLMIVVYEVAVQIIPHLTTPNVDNLIIIGLVHIYVSDSLGVGTIPESYSC